MPTTVGPIVLRVLPLAVPSLWWLGWLFCALLVEDDVTPPRWFTVCYVAIASVAFMAAALLGARKRLTARGLPFRELPDGSTWGLYCIVTVVNGFFAVRAISMYSIYGAFIRQAVFDFNADLFFSTWLHVVYTLTIYPLTAMLVMYAATIGVFHASFRWLLVGVGTAAVADLVYFGRFNLYTYFISIAFATIVQRVLWGRVRRGMVVIIGSAVVLLAGYVLISNARDGAVFRFRGDLYGSQITRYHTLGILLFDRQLAGERLAEFETGFGRCTFGIIDLSIGLLIRRFGSSYEPFSRAVDYERQVYVDVGINNGKVIYVNAFYTGFSSLVLDFGVAGSLVAVAILGFWFGRVYSTVIRTGSLCAATLFVYLGVMFCRFLFNSPLEAPFFWLVAVMLWLAMRYERRPRMPGVGGTAGKVPSVCS